MELIYSTQAHNTERLKAMKQEEEKAIVKLA